MGSDANRRTVPAWRVGAEGIRLEPFSSPGQHRGRMRCSGFTISHIDGIMHACPPSPTRRRSSSAEMRAAGISGVLGLLLRLPPQPLRAA
jgi:hypothetical protein